MPPTTPTKEPRTGTRVPQGTICTTFMAEEAIGSSGSAIQVISPPTIQGIVFLPASVSPRTTSPARHCHSHRDRDHDRDYENETDFDPNHIVRHYYCMNVDITRVTTGIIRTTPRLGPATTVAALVTDHTLSSAADRLRLRLRVRRGKRNAPSSRAVSLATSTTLSATAPCVASAMPPR
jgi:hypothetical protein